MSARYLTVVFAIEDEEVFKKELPDLHAKMMTGKDEPWRVTGMSLGDEMTRVELLEQAVNSLSGDELNLACATIFSTPLESLEEMQLADLYS